MLAAHRNQFAPRGKRAGDPQTFANAEAFNSEYGKTVAALTAMGIRVEKTCGEDYCANVMVYAGPARANSVYDVTKTDGSRWRKICAGDSTLRQCAFSDGAIVEETFKDGEWKLGRTVARGFGFESIKLGVQRCWQASLFEHRDYTFIKLITGLWFSSKNVLRTTGWSQAGLNLPTQGPLL